MAKNEFAHVLSARRGLSPAADAIIKVGEKIRLAEQERAGGGRAQANGPFAHLLTGRQPLSKGMSPAAAAIIEMGERIRLAEQEVARG